MSPKKVRGPTAYDFAGWLLDNHHTNVSIDARDSTSSSCCCTMLFSSVFVLGFKLLGTVSFMELFDAWS